LVLLTQLLVPSYTNVLMRNFLKLTVLNEVFPMRWATLTFGKHTGKTIPEIILSDADWFCWAVNKADSMIRLQSLSKGPERSKSPNVIRNWQVEYSYDDTGGFCGFQFVKADTPLPYRSRSIRRSPYLDLSYVRRGKAYDKRGCRNLLRDFRHHFFGDNTRLTKRRCQQFFSNKQNFLRAASS
jgi:hypothetical protein